MLPSPTFIENGTDPGCCGKVWPPAPLVKRAATDDSPGGQVVALAKAYHPEDPWGAGLAYVQRHYPQLWRQYRQDYAD